VTALRCVSAEIWADPVVFHAIGEVEPLDHEAQLFAFNSGLQLEQADEGLAHELEAIDLPLGIEELESEPSNGIHDGVHRRRVVGDAIPLGAIFFSQLLRGVFGAEEVVPD
jgi:hypothetical protein